MSKAEPSAERAQEEEDMSTLKSLLTSAQKAYKAGEYEAALDCCKRALRTEDGEQSAMVHLTFAVCHTQGSNP